MPPGPAGPTIGQVLSDHDIERFEADGYVAVRQAVPPAVLAECTQQLHRQLSDAGVDTVDPTTWNEPVLRLDCPETPAFASAGTQPVLWDAYDQLLGPGRHVKRKGVGGSVAVRFPSVSDPGDAGWHIDGSFFVDGGWGVNVYSRGRGLLCLFLFSDVGPNDAPTEIKPGSQVLVPPTLLELGEAGGLYDPKTTDAWSAMSELPSAFATGQAGDVYICHPFLVHRATWPHTGTRPRIIAQPEIGIHEPFALSGEGEPFPVERAILAGLASQLRGELPGS